MKKKSKAFKKISAGLDDALRHAQGDKSVGKEQIVLGGKLVLDSDALLAALHLTVAHKAVEEHISDDNLGTTLEAIGDDIVAHLKKALGL